MIKSSWQDMIDELLADELKGQTIVHSTISTEDLNRTFNADYGYEEGIPFYAWTENFVIFCVAYDGLEYLGYVPRDPNYEIKAKHWGG